MTTPFPRLPLHTMLLYVLNMLGFRFNDTFIRRARTSIGKTTTSEITPEIPPDTTVSTVLTTHSYLDTE